MAPATDTTDPAFGDDLTFTRQTNREAVGGTWAIGLVAGHRFQALVFADHADDPSWELGDSRISKLWVQRVADRTVVFHFDRGFDVPAEDAAARWWTSSPRAWPNTSSGKAETPFRAKGVAASGSRRLTTATNTTPETNVTTKKTATAKKSKTAKKLSALDAAAQVLAGNGGAMTTRN